MIDAESHRRLSLRALSLVVFAAALAGCQSKNQFVPPPPPQVTVEQPVEKSLADSVEFVGRTAATATVDLRARVNGYLEKITFEDGANVKAGELLFVIEQAPYKIALESAKAELAKAEATLELAKSQYNRIEPLVPSGAITKDELEAQAAQVKTSIAAVDAAKSAVNHAELDLSYTEVRAPISGHIGRHLVDIGNLVQAEQTPLAVIQSIDPIYATFDVSELDLLRFMKMLRAHELPDPAVTPPTLWLGLANEKGYPHEGRLDYRELGVDPNTGTTMRRGIFPNSDGTMIPGLRVRVFANVGQPQPRLLVPDIAVGTDQRGDYLLTVNDKNVVEYKPVKLGISDGAMRVIDDGIGPNEWVIVNGLQRARPGITVNPHREEKAEATQPDATAAAADKPTTTEHEASKAEPTPSVPATTSEK